jgi:hypothetical protein
MKHYPESARGRKLYGGCLTKDEENERDANVYYKTEYPENMLKKIALK